MSASTAARVPVARTKGRFGGRRARLVVGLLPVAIAVMIGVDTVLGDSAEYFNAASLLEAWGGVLSGHGVNGETFLVGQERLGDALSLGIGSTLLVVEPAVVLVGLVYGGSAVARLARGRRTR
jgi:hypothetical protein